LCLLAGSFAQKVPAPFLSFTLFLFFMQANLSHVVVVIPAYNEEASLPLVLA